MIHCQNCGNINNQGSNFCRFCGAKIVLPPPPPQFFAPQQPPLPPPSFYQPRQPQPLPSESYENNPPRPYSWKTDEYQAVDAKARKTREAARVQPLGSFGQNPAAAPQSMVYHQQAMATAYGYRCPRCGTQNLPLVSRKISTAGWIVFAVLLIFTFFFFWIGLLMKEDVRVCPVCGLRVG